MKGLFDQKGFHFSYSKTTLVNSKQYCITFLYTKTLNLGLKQIWDINLIVSGLEIIFFKTDQAIPDKKSMKKSLFR